MFDRIPSAVVTSAFDQRPTYKLLSHISELFEKTKPVLKKKIALFKDNGEDSRAAFVNLRKMHADALAMVGEEENAREQFSLPETIYQEHQQLEKFYKEEQAELESLQKKLKKEETKLKQRQSELGEDIQTATVKRSGDQGDVVVETNLAFDEFGRERILLLEQRDELDRKINSGCCSCVVTKKRRRMMDDLQSVKNQIADLDSRVAAKKQEKFTNPALAQVQALEVELQDVREQLSEHYEASGKEIEKMIKRVYKAKLQVQIKQAAIEQLQRLQYGKISAELTYQLLLFVNEFHQFEVKIKAFLTKNTVDGEGGYLISLQKARERSDELIEVLYCDAFQRLTIKMLLENENTKTAALSSFEALSKLFTSQPLSLTK